MSQLTGIYSTLTLRDGTPEHCQGEAYRRELMAVLRSLDAHRIAAFATQHGAKLDTLGDMKTFWRAVHTIRLKVPELTEEEHAASRAWLAANVSGYGKQKVVPYGRRAPGAPCAGGSGKG